MLGEKYVLRNEDYKTATRCGPFSAVPTSATAAPPTHSSTASMYGRFSPLEGAGVRESGSRTRGGGVSCYAIVTAVKGERPKPLYCPFYTSAAFGDLTVLSKRQCRLRSKPSLSQTNELPLLLGTSRARLCNPDLIRHLIKSARSRICSDSGGRGVFL